MHKIFAAFLLTLSLVTSHDLMSEKMPSSQNRHAKTHAFNKSLVKRHRQFPILTNHGKMIFNFAVGPVSFAPGETPLLFRVYIVAPNGKRINGPKINGHSAISAFSVVVHPPILFGTYTIVVENINIPENTQTFIDKNVVITNSLNTKQAKTTIVAPLNTPGDPGDTLVGYFNPIHSFFSH